MNGFEKRTEEKKKKVIEAAFELMNTDNHGANVTIEDIAKHAGVGKTTVFKYFGNKDNLIKEVFQNCLDELVVSAQEVLEQEKSFEETLISLTQNKIDLLNRINKPFYSIMMEYVTEKDDTGSSLMMEKYTRNNYGMMLDLFHRGRKEGKVDLKYSDEFLILYFQTIVEGISNPNIYEKIKPYTREWTEMLIKGIAPSRRS